MTNLPAVFIKPNVWTINRPQRVLVRQQYRMMRKDGVPRIHAHLVVRSLLDVGGRAGRTDGLMQSQWPADKFR